MVVMSLSPDLPKSGRCKLQVAARGSLSLFLENVQHVNGVGKRRDVDHAIRTGGTSNPDLANACADRWHRFPIAGILPFLDLMKLMAGLPACFIGEATQALKCVSVKRYRFYGHDA
jgi:hypothetical protein